VATDIVKMFMMTPAQDLKRKCTELGLSKDGAAKLTTELRFVLSTLAAEDGALVPSGAADKVCAGMHRCFRITAAQLDRCSTHQVDSTKRRPYHQELMMVGWYWTKFWKDASDELCGPVR
jgi:hypothetical protein